MAGALENWTPRARPAPVTLAGRYVRLEPLDPGRHARDLYAASSPPDAAARFAWLAEMPPADRATFDRWIESRAASADPMFWAVVDAATGIAGGRQALMRIDHASGVIEIGNIYWGPGIARSRAATEALFLHMRHVFEDLGYRRFEWKCNDRNAPSKRAALRFGFRAEGLFRQHMIVKGESRDTAWFAVIDRDWPALRLAYEGWLDPANFDARCNQKRPLAAFMAG